MATAAGRALSEIAAYTSGGKGTVMADVVEKRINALIRRDEAGKDIAAKLAVARAGVDVVISKKPATPLGPYVPSSIGQDYVIVQPLEGQTYATPE